MGRTKQLFEDMRLKQQDFFYKKINYEAELEYIQYKNCDNRVLDTRVGG